MQDIIEIEIEDFAYGKGEGVGRVDNYVVFVPWTVLKDRVRVRLKRKRASYADGELIEIVKESPYRVPPKCDAFTKCGGCNLQNLSYQKQLELKEHQVIESFKRIGHIEIEDLLPIIPSPKQWFYRNKMEFCFGGSNSQLLLGLHPKGSYKEVVNLKGCYIFSPHTGIILETVKEFLKGIPPYNPISHKGVLRHLVIREAKFTEEIMINLVTSEWIEDMKKLADMLKEKVPNIRTILWTRNRRISDAVIPEEEKVITGDGYITECIDDLLFKITPWSFFQPNSYITPILYKRVIDLMKDNRFILDLFSGSGGISLFLAREGKRVIGIDMNKECVKSAVESMRMNKIEGCEFIQGDVRKVLYERRREWKGRVDGIVVDPPRTGLSKKVIKRLAELKAQRVVYISCNPSTLARDAALLREQGYRVEKVQPLDMFPHTHHIELLALLSYE